jgi:type I restriction enzyme M protein
VIKQHGKELDPDQKKHLKKGFVHGWELVPNTARLCVMNLYLHGIDADPCPVRSGVDSLASHPGQHFSLVLTNPPFGKKSSCMASISLSALATIRSDGGGEVLAVFGSGLGDN